VARKPPSATVGPVDSTNSIYSGVDHLGTLGKVAAGLFAVWTIFAAIPGVPLSGLASGRAKRGLG
jgi:hypothetical protein